MDAGWRGEELPDLRMLGHAPATSDAAGEPLLLLQTLGACVVRVGERRIDPSMEILFALVIRLTHTPGMRVPRSVLLAELWVGMPELRARANLRQALYKLRGYGVRVLQVGEEVTLERAGCVRVFALERTGAQFEACVTRGNEPFGLFLPGYRPQWPAFERWLGAAREAVHADVRGVLVEQLRARRQRADWSGTHALARWLLQFDPLNEDATLAHAECTMMGGAKAEAVAILDAYLAELGSAAGDIRLPATLLRRRITEARPVGRLAIAPSERHFVGREDLMTELAHQMRRARWREGSVLMLSGPAGMGKSRVMRELAKIAALEGFQAVTIACRESDRERPLGVLRELVSELLELPGAMGCAPPTLRVLRRFSASVDRGERDGAEEVLDESPPTPAALRRAIVDLLSAIGYETPVCLEVDDVHWLDGESGKVIGELCLLEDHRVFAVLTSRGDATPWLAPEQRRALVRHELEPLRADQASALVEAMAEEMCVLLPDDAFNWMVDTGGGNPFYLRGLLAHWADTGSTQGVPPTLSELVDNSLTQLSTDSIHTLQAIALLGRYASGRAVEETLELPTARLLSVLDELSHSALVRALPGDGIAVHDLVRSSALRQLSSVAHRVLHLRIASYLRSQSHADDAGAMIEAISHLSAAGASDEVLSFSKAMVQRFLELGRPFIATAVADESLRCCVGVRQDEQWRELRSRALFESGSHSRLLSEAEPGNEVTSEAIASDARAQAILEGIDSTRFSLVWEDYVEYTSRAVLISESSSASWPTRFKAACIAIKLAIYSPEPDLITRALMSGRKSASKLPNPVLASAELEVYYQTSFGDSSRALAAALMLKDQPRQAFESERAWLLALSNAGYALRVNGRSSEAAQLHARLLEIAAKHDQFSLAATNAWNAALCHIDHQFDPALASGFLARGFELVKLISSEISSTVLYESSAKLAILTGDPHAADQALIEIHNSYAKSAIVQRRATYLSLEVGSAIIADDHDRLLRFWNEALDHFTHVRTLIGQDFFAVQLFNGLELLGRQGEAIDLIKSYISRDRRVGQEFPWYLNNIAIKHLPEAISALNHATAGVR